MGTLGTPGRGSGFRFQSSGFRVGMEGVQRWLAGPAAARRVCWLGPEPQGTPSHNFLPPNGLPSHHLGL